MANEGEGEGGGEAKSKGPKYRQENEKI
jgi:hypothetical protein